MVERDLPRPGSDPRAASSMLFIPYATNCERTRFPLVTVLLIALNVAILVMQFMA